MNTQEPVRNTSFITAAVTAILLALPAFGIGDNLTDEQKAAIKNIANTILIPGLVIGAGQLARRKVSPVDKLNELEAKNSQLQERLNYYQGLKK